MIMPQIPQCSFTSASPTPSPKKTIFGWKWKGGRKAVCHFLPLPHPEPWRRETSFGILELWLWGSLVSSHICHSAGAKAGSPLYSLRHFVWIIRLMSVDLSFMSGVTNPNWRMWHCRADKMLPHASRYLIGATVLQGGSSCPNFMTGSQGDVRSSDFHLATAWKWQPGCQPKPSDPRSCFFCSLWRMGISGDAQLPAHSLSCLRRPFLTSLLQHLSATVLRNVAFKARLMN